MDTREKIVIRARLIASGIIRYHKLDTPQEVGRWLEILTEELSCITSENEVLTILGRLERYGLRVPDVSHAMQGVHGDGQVSPKTSGQSGDWDSQEVCSNLKNIDTKKNPVHASAAGGAQVVQKPCSSQNPRDGSGIYKGITLRTAPLTTQQCNSSYGTVNEAGRARTERATRIDGKAKHHRSTGSWTWRNWSYNRVPPAIEEAVREKFKQGWSKSRLAREFRLNRRTIIRVCNASAAD